MFCNLSGTASGNCYYTRLKAEKALRRVLFVLSRICLKASNPMTEF